MPRHCSILRRNTGQHQQVKRMFRKALIVAVTFTAWPGFSTVAAAEELLREFAGTESTITSTFSVDGPWLLDWRVNSDFSRFMAVDIVLLDGETGFQVGLIKHKKEPDNGLRLFRRGGRYKVRVDSSHTRWQVKIIQITEAEAERYTPRDSS
jgi:hypothetical protein